MIVASTRWPPMVSAPPPSATAGTLTGGSVVVVATVVVGATVVVVVATVVAVAGRAEPSLSRTGTVVVTPLDTLVGVAVVDGATVVADDTDVVVVVAKEPDDGAFVVVVAGADVVVTLVSIVTLVADDTDVGPVFDAPSVTEFADRRATTVPSEEHVTATVTDEPDDADGVNTQPVAVPPFEKSDPAIPDTDSEKVSVYDNVRDEDGDTGDVHDADGGVVSETNAVFLKTPLE